MGLIGEPVAPAEVLLEYEIKGWIRRWRDRRMTLGQVRAECRRIHQDIERIRGKQAGGLWWQELIKQQPKLK